jgi:hypothetical protein
VVERDLAKVDVAGSTPVSRSRSLLKKPRAWRGLFQCSEAVSPDGQLPEMALT